MDAKILGLCSTAIIVAAAGAIPVSSLAAAARSEEGVYKATNATPRRPRMISGTIIPAGPSIFMPAGTTPMREGTPIIARAGVEPVGDTNTPGAGTTGAGPPMAVSGAGVAPQPTGAAGRASPRCGDGAKFGYANLDCRSSRDASPDNRARAKRAVRTGSGNPALRRGSP